MYSRRTTTEERKNKRSAAIFILLTIAGICFLFFWGISGIVKFSAFLGDLRNSSEPVEQNDTTPPPPPKLDPLPSATNKREIDVAGTSEASATVVLKVNSDENEIVANSDGKFFYKLKLEVGENDIEAYALDKSGNKSQDAPKTSVIFDNEPPELEITRPKDQSEYFGSLQRQLIIEGKTEPDSVVTVNGRFVIVDSGGGFSFSTTLTHGDNSFVVKTQDSATNTTEKNLTVRFTP